MKYQSFSALYKTTLEIENGLRLIFNEMLWSIYGGPKITWFGPMIQCSTLGRVEFFFFFQSKLHYGKK